MQNQNKKFSDIIEILKAKGYQTIKVLGRGAFGEVLLVENQHKSWFAAKVIKNNYSEIKYIHQEISVMKNFNHPNIISYHQSFFTNNFIFIIMEYCDYGNLYGYQVKIAGGTFKLDEAVKIMVQLLKGLKCIHQKNIIHRDLKPENILLKTIKLNNQDVVQYKISDFGFSRPAGVLGAKTQCGTQKFMAPEIFANDFYGHSVDLWALAVIFYFMLFAQHPFKGYAIRADIRTKCTPNFNVQKMVKRKQKLSEINEDVEDFFKKIFVVDPKKRIKFSQLLQHPLFQPYSKEFQLDHTTIFELEKNQTLIKDEDEGEIAKDLFDQMETEDATRVSLLRKNSVENTEKHIERQLEEISFQIKKVLYLKECAQQFFDFYRSYLSYPQRLALHFYLLKGFIFFCEPLLANLKEKKFPDSLADADIDFTAWKSCTKSKYYEKYVDKLELQLLKTRILFEDTYSRISEVMNQIKIKYFENGFKPDITQKTFEEFKVPYRSTTSYIFKKIHQNKDIDNHLKNKIKMRIFCCHAINRIFVRKEIPKNFPYFIQWLKINNIKYKHTFDFVFFKKWILEEKQDNLHQNISLVDLMLFPKKKT